MDQVTQQNAALVEEAAAAAQAMQDQAGQLAHVVHVFKLAGDVDEPSANDEPEQSNAPAIAPQPTAHVIPAPVRSGAPAVPPRTKLAAVTRTGTDDWEEF
jgi:methyl-accepting chemotaxis protein